MELQERLARERVKHIIHSYRLAGEEPEAVEACLETLFQRYPMPLVELAIAETLVDGWLNVPLVRGMEFFKQAQSRLQNWESQPIVSTLTPEQFQQITGLDPSPVFGSAEKPPSRPIVHPS